MSVGDNHVQEIMDLAAGCFSARVVHLAADLGLADQLKQGPRSAEDLALATQTHAGSLYRLLRVLASLGIVEQCADARFELTDLGATLSSDGAKSVRAAVQMFGMWWASWEQLEHSIRTGEAAAPHVFGRTIFEHLAEHPDLAQIFHAGMGSLNAALLPALVAAYDFGRHRTIIDIAGGHGTLLATLLEAAPESKGVLLERPEVIAGAEATLDQHGLGSRSRCVAGDMFAAVPSGGDAYILKWIIHDWDDDDCATILSNIRSVMTATSRLLIIDRVLPERAEPTAASLRMMLADLRMLVIPGGRERSAANMRALLERAGLALEQIINTTTPSSIIVARRCDIE